MKLKDRTEWTDHVEFVIRYNIVKYIIDKFNDNWGYVMQIEFDMKNDIYKLKAYVETKHPQDFEMIRNIFTMNKNYIPHVEKVTKFNRLSCIKHCSKIENRVGDVWSYKLEIQNYPPDPLEGKKLRPFQQQIMDILKTDPDDRVIHWYWDFDGNTGKSAFIKHMIIKYGKKNVFPIGGQKGVIQKYMLHKLKNNESFRYLFFDLSRSDEKHFPYDIMEKLKDGIVHTGSYGGYKTFLIPTPHIIIFAHRPPKRRLISLDRWHIVEIGNNGGIINEELPEKNVQESSEELDS